MTGTRALRTGPTNRRCLRRRLVPAAVITLFGVASLGLVSCGDDDDNSQTDDTSWDTPDVPDDADAPAPGRTPGDEPDASFEDDPTTDTQSVEELRDDSASEPAN